MKHVEGRKYVFALAHLWKDEKYVKWFRKEQSLGSTIILDNGQWEERYMNFSDLTKAIEVFNADVFVLPDIIGNGKATRMLSDSFISYWLAGDRKCYPATMYVIHGEDVWDYMEQYQSTDSPWIGFPRRMGGLRVEVATRLHQLGLWKAGYLHRHHALGMLSGDKSEYDKLRKLGFTSQDSSNPVWRQAMNRINDINFDFDNYYNYREAIHNALRGLEDDETRPTPNTPTTALDSDSDIPF